MLVIIIQINSGILPLVVTTVDSSKTEYSFNMPDTSSLAAGEKVPSWPTIIGFDHYNFTLSI